LIPPRSAAKRLKEQRQRELLAKATAQVIAIGI
jgi:hypothetical protein